jgi:hypothetical protein
LHTQKKIVIGDDLDSEFLWVLNGLKIFVDVKKLYHHDLPVGD